MRRVWTTARGRAAGKGVRRAAILVPGVIGLLTAAVMSATAATAPPPSTLSANGVLSYPNYLQSPDGHYHLVMTKQRQPGRDHPRRSARSGRRAPTSTRERGP